MNKKTKQIAAIIGVVLLVGLYAATFFFAITDSPNSGRMFQASLYGTIAVPILLWIYMWLFQKWMERKQPDTETADANEDEK